MNFAGLIEAVEDLPSFDIEGEDDVLLFFAGESP